jgi:NifU-like protein involved in Fe-S cluster formation
MYNEILLRHVAGPYHMHSMDDADGVGQVGFPGEGAFMLFYMKCGSGDAIDSASFETYGCPSAIGCGSWLTRWVEGKTLSQASLISAADLMAALGGLPLGKEGAATMAISAFHYAVEECQAVRNQ